MSHQFYKPIQIVDLGSLTQEQLQDLLEVPETGLRTLYFRNGQLYTYDQLMVETQISGSGGGGGSDSSFPYYIPEGQTYTVPRYKQGLFTMNFIADGVIDTDGVMVEVS